jgi:1-deoxy-D-xylulose-5-phosphate reductoisomerase
MVEFTDGSVLAQLSQTDMGFPIQYALTYPTRLKGALEPLDFATLSKLEFSTPRLDDFPALNLARKAGLTGGTLPAVFNAANEVSVQAFREGRIRFPEIWGTVAAVMAAHETIPSPTLDQILQADCEARITANQITERGL